MTELLVSIQLRFPVLDKQALAEHLSPVVTEAIKAGGVHFSLSIAEFEPEDDDD